MHVWKIFLCVNVCVCVCVCGICSTAWLAATLIPSFVLDTVGALVCLCYVCVCVCVCVCAGMHRQTAILHLSKVHFERLLAKLCAFRHGVLGCYSQQNLQQILQMRISHQHVFVRAQCVRLLLEVKAASHPSKVHFEGFLASVRSGMVSVSGC